ncbi:MAG: hypothetical protein ACI909_002860, partial [Planctomycetota bacterium]
TFSAIPTTTGLAPVVLVMAEKKVLKRNLRFDNLTKEDWTP